MNENELQFHMETDKNLLEMDVPSQRIIEIGLRAPLAAKSSTRPPLNLALVLDRSGSMSGEKLEYVRQAAAHVLDLLQEQDSASVVAYDDEIQLVAPASRMTNPNRVDLKSRVSRIRPGGSTNLFGGWMAGCQEAASAAREGTLNRALLLTDGLANRGETDLETLAAHAKELSKRGVSTTTFGVGMGFNEHLLEAMSNQGGGNFYYIETPAEIPGLFQREFQELAAVTASDVAINIDFPASMRLDVLGGWAVEFSSGHARISLGSLYSGQNRELYIKILTPPGGKSDDMQLKAVLSGKSESGKQLRIKSELVFKYDDRENVAAVPVKRELMQRFALIDLAETAGQALKLERQGERIKAGNMLKRAVEEHRPFAPAIQTEMYQQISERMKDGMDEADRKQSHYASYNVKRQRGQQ